MKSLHQDNESPQTCVIALVTIFEPYFDSDDETIAAVENPSDSQEDVYETDIWNLSNIVG